MDFKTLNPIYSQPLKIHCSEQFKNVLDRLGGYLLHERGFISIKGKGDLRTFWLISESEERKRRRKSISNSERIRSSITEILFSQKSKSSHTPEMRTKQVSIDLLRSTSPRVNKYGSSDDNNDKPLKPLFPIFEKNNSLKERSEMNQLRDFCDLTQISSSKSQFSLNFFSNSKNKISSLFPTSHSITINEIPLTKDIDPPPYKLLNFTESAKIKSENLCSNNHKESSLNFSKFSGSQNGFFSRKTVSLPPSVMQRKLSRTESLPQIKLTQTNAVSTIHEMT
jgi:hypothetical protein